MLVYGDAVHEELPSALRSAIAEKIDACLRMPAGRARHELLVRAFIQTGELAQGLDDHAFEQNGADDLSPIRDAGARLLLQQAIAIDRSWRNGFGGALTVADDWAPLLDQLDAEAPIGTKRAEGYSFYALYPESYLAAARNSGLGADTVVIGLRSIGTGLAALVSAALGAGPAFTLRPTGHPFQRGIAATPALSREILKNEGASYAIVDEGPGLSGSSFGCVADWLETHGVPESRIHFFPSHKGGLGPQASDSHRQRWERLPRHCVDADETVIQAAHPAHRLQNWVSELIDAEITCWSDISGGAWRDLGHIDSRDRPPADTQLEKRKFLARAGDRAWLVKFAGLGEDGARKARTASLLSEAGFTPKVAGMRYGFLVEKWSPGRRLSDGVASRSEIVETLGRYLGFRAKHLKAPASGASLQQLRSMAAVNAEEALGHAATDAIGALIQDPDRFAAVLRPVDTDNRLRAWEWILQADGSILKTDAVDHSAAHDLIGCQDIAWDLAGAAVEFELSGPERSRFTDLVAAKAGYETDPDLIALFELFYLCFQAGLWTNASASLSGDDARLAAGLVKRYTARLARLAENARSSPLALRTAAARPLQDARLSPPDRLPAPDWHG